MKTNNLILVGHFSVDSGQAMIGDPCYLDNWQPWDSDKNSFDEHMQKAGEYDNYGELGNSSAVVFSTGYGDGLYPVYAEINEDGRVAKIVVDFIGDEDE
jgi:hypothetical protein